MANKTKKIRLSQSNKHLLDLFTENSYLELGNIDYRMIKRLLAYQVINIHDVFDKALLTRSIGADHIQNPQLREMLPFFHFVNLNRKNPSFHLFLTYGLIAYKNDNGKESFSPLILIPIVIDFDAKTYDITMIKQPIINDLLMAKIDKNQTIIDNDKLTTIFAFDNFCKQCNQLPNVRLMVENYLTFAQIDEPQIVLNHDLFSLKNKFKPLHSRYYDEESNHVYFVTPLNNKQRLALQRASSGNSFALSGAFGTGKTTTLINIAADAIMRNKKVLYVSNDNETLDLVHEFFLKKGLEFLIANLSNSYVQPIHNINEHQKQATNAFEIKNSLRDVYEMLERYQNLWYERILHFRFIDVVEKMIKAKEIECDCEIDQLDNIYKHEYEEIMHSLKTIENDMVKIPHFQSSKFIHIPINHTIKYPNQVITLLFEMHQLFTQLKQDKNQLEVDYGFNTITNYARFKNIISHFNALDITKVPQSWVEDTQNFHAAFAAFTNLKNDVYAMHECELYLGWDFKNYEQFPIDQAIDDICDQFFTTNDTDAINAVLDKHLEMIVRLRIANHQGRLLQRNIGVLKELLHWDFDENNIHVMQELLRLTDYINENIIYDGWLNEDKADMIRKKIASNLEKLLKWHTLYHQYGKHFTKKPLQVMLTSLYRRKDKSFVCRLYKEKDYHVLVDELEELQKLTENLESLKMEYKKLTGIKFHQDDDILRDFDHCQQYLSKFTNSTVKAKIVSFLSSIDFEKMGDYLQALNNFKKAYDIVSHTLIYLARFFPFEDHSTLSQQLHFLENMYQYISKVRSHNHEMRSIIKVDRDIVPFDVYLLLQKRTHELKTIKRKINRNKDYPHLYGSMFAKEATNINEIGLVLKNFQLFMDCFASDDALHNGLNPKVHQIILGKVDTSTEKIDALHDMFALYTKIFKDGIGGYYYDAFEDVIEKIDERLKAKDELLTYLDITDHLKILGKYKLYILTNLIVENKVSEPANLFNFRYFNRLYTMFVEKYPMITQTSTIEDACKKFVTLEEKLIVHHIQLLQDKKHNRSDRPIYFSRQHQQIDLKPLCLARSHALDYALDIDDFDIVLLDDAHFLHANHYHLVVQGKQIVMAGEKNILPFSGSNLMLRMRPANIMRLTFCYTPTPLAFSSVGLDIHNFFLPKVKENEAFSILKGDVASYVIHILQETPGVIINVFTTSYAKKIAITEEIAKKLIALHMPMQTIFTFLEKRLNIVDLFAGQVIAAEYNILLLEDYYLADDEFIELQSISHLFLCCKKLIVLDNQDCLWQKPTTRFLSIIQSFVEQKSMLFASSITFALQKLADYLSKQGFVICGSHYDVQLVVKKNDYYYAFKLFVNPQASHINILESYRQYRVFVKHGLNVYVVWLMDLLHRFEETIEKWLEEIQS